MPFSINNGLDDPALHKLALIVRGVDTSRLDLTPQSAGLFAISLGLSALYADDHELLGHGMTIYEALYAWCRSGDADTHNWPSASHSFAEDGSFWTYFPSQRTYQIGCYCDPIYARGPRYLPSGAEKSDLIRIIPVTVMRPIMAMTGFRTANRIAPSANLGATAARAILASVLGSSRRMEFTNGLASFMPVLPATRPAPAAALAAALPLVREVVLRATLLFDRLEPEPGDVGILHSLLVLNVSGSERRYGSLVPVL